VLTSAVVQQPDTDEELATRQSALHAEATALLDELAQARVFDDIGPMAVTGSYVSHLMCWRDLDVMLLVGADYRPRDVLKLISGSTSRCGCAILTKTSRLGMRHCVTRSLTANVRQCCGSRTCGFACRATPIGLVAPRSTPPLSMTASEHRSSSAAGSPIAG
jgi:hypothetical protein